MSEPSTSRFEPTGQMQFVPPERLTRAARLLADEYERAARDKAHLWLVLVTFKASAAILDGQDQRTGGADDAGVLDADSLRGQPVVACYSCGAAYTPDQRNSLCPGDPEGPLL